MDRTRPQALVCALALVVPLSACDAKNDPAPTIWQTQTATTYAESTSPSGGDATAASTSSTVTPASTQRLSFARPTGQTFRAESRAAFLSEGGTTECLVTTTGVLCEPHTKWGEPAGGAAEPTGYCAGALHVNGYMVADQGAAWFCGQPNPVHAGQGSSDTEWGRDGGDEKEGKTVLRYGDAILVGDYQCLDLASGVECQRLSTGEGFKVTKDALLWSVTKPGPKSQYAAR